MSIPNRFDIVHAVNVAHPHLIQRNTRETVTEFLWRVVWALSQTDANFGFLSKSAAENHTDIPGAGMVALDALCYRGEHNSVDIAASAGDGPGKGGIGWSEDEHRRPSNLWVRAVPYPDSPVPPPDPPSDDLEARVAALEAQVRALVPAVEKANDKANGAYLRAEQAVDTAAMCAERIDRLKATGAIDLPVVVDLWNRKARAKGDVALKVTD